MLNWWVTGGLALLLGAAALHDRWQRRRRARRPVGGFGGGDFGGGDFGGFDGGGGGGDGGGC